MANNKVLIVEDSEFGRSYKDILEESLSVQAFWAKNKGEAIAIVEGNHIKVALLDQRLQAGELGTEVFKSIKMLQPNIIGIMLSGRAEKKEVGEAIGDLGYYKYVDKEDILNLPEIVVNALEKFNLDLLQASVSKRRRLIYRFRKGFRLYEWYNVYLRSRSLLDKEFVFNDKWIEKLSVVAGEKIEGEIEFELEDKLELEVTSSMELATKYSLKLEAFKSSVENELTGKIGFEEKTTESHSVKRKTKFKSSLSVPDIPSDVEKDYLASKSFEVNQVYEKYLNVLEVVCPFCNTSELYSLVSYTPTNKIAKRQVDRLRSGKVTFINDGIVTR